MKLYDFQNKVIEQTKDRNKVAYYLDMGLGKTFVGAEKMSLLGANTNLVVCQKSKINDWTSHFNTHYPNFEVFDLTDKKQMQAFLIGASKASVGVINYDLFWRRKEIADLEDFTLMLDESSLIQNEASKRSSFILKKMRPSNVILLSGTPVGGKYENLWSQLRMLGWNISRDLYWKQYVCFHYDKRQGFPLLVVDGYKNVERLKAKMNDLGCVFMKTNEVFDLPKQMYIQKNIPTTKEYKTFLKKRIVEVGDRTFIGDSTLNTMLFSRQLCGRYNQAKLDALEDILESTSDRVIVFYNFSNELYEVENICHKLKKPTSIVNGREKDLSCYEQYDDCVVIVQYQAGAMGLNLQKACRIVYFSPPLSSELYEQSKKRIHRIGQENTCFYYKLVCGIEYGIYKALDAKRDYTDYLFVKDLENEKVSSNVSR